MASRPNFLFFITDQQRADHLGCYGNRLVRTPAVDALAREGWCAEEFYTATPICMPNRASLMTGRMPSRHGVRHNGIELSLDETTFVETLRAAGYATAHVGKSHLQKWIQVLHQGYIDRYQSCTKTLTALLCCFHAKVIQNGFEKRKRWPR